MLTFHVLKFPANSTSPSTLQPGLSLLPCELHFPCSIMRTTAFHVLTLEQASMPSAALGQATCHLPYSVRGILASPRVASSRESACTVLLCTPMSCGTSPLHVLELCPSSLTYRACSSLQSSATLSRPRMPLAPHRIGALPAARLRPHHRTWTVPAHSSALSGI